MKIPQHVYYFGNWRMDCRNYPRVRVVIGSQPAVTETAESHMDYILQAIRESVRTGSVREETMYRRIEQQMFCILRTEYNYPFNRR